MQTTPDIMLVRGLIRVARETTQPQGRHSGSGNVAAALFIVTRAAYRRYNSSPHAMHVGFVRVRTQQNIFILLRSSNAESNKIIVLLAVRAR